MSKTATLLQLSAVLSATGQWWKMPSIFGETEYITTESIELVDYMRGGFTPFMLPGCTDNIDIILLIKPREKVYTDRDGKITDVWCFAQSINLFLLKRLWLTSILNLLKLSWPRLRVHTRLAAHTFRSGVALFEKMMKTVRITGGWNWWKSL